MELRSKLKKIQNCHLVWMQRAVCGVVSLLMVSCSKEPPELTDLEDCFNHYQAESYLVAEESCQLAADEGESQAQWLLANIYRFDLLKNGEDLENAFHWYLKAAQHGHVAAMREVGNAYLYEYGVSLNLEQAQIWLNKAAKQDDSIAAFSLGYMYLDGKGRDKDIGSAINWFKRAAVQNHAMSINNLTWIYATSDNPAFFSAKKATYWLGKMDKTLFDVPMFLDTKAAVVAAQGDFEQAINLQNSAIALLASDTPESEMLEFQKHLEQYEKGQPWKE